MTLRDALCLALEAVTLPPSRRAVERALNAAGWPYVDETDVELADVPGGVRVTLWHGLASESRVVARAP